MPSVRVLAVQLDPSDPPARLGEWLTAAGVEVDLRALDAGDELPADLTGQRVRRPGRARRLDGRARRRRRAVPARRPRAAARRGRGRGARRSASAWVTSCSPSRTAAGCAACPDGPGDRRAARREAGRRGDRPAVRARCRSPRRDPVACRRGERRCRRAPSSWPARRAARSRRSGSAGWPGASSSTSRPRRSIVRDWADDDADDARRLRRRARSWRAPTPSTTTSSRCGSRSPPRSSTSCATRPRSPAPTVRADVDRRAGDRSGRDPGRARRRGWPRRRAVLPDARAAQPRR